MQGFERGDARGEEADAGGEGAALVVNVEAEAAEVLADEAEIDGFALLQVFELPGLEQGEDLAADILGIERFGGEGREAAVDAEGDGDAGDEEDVGGAAGGGAVEDGVEGGGGLSGKLRGGRGFAAGGGAVELADEFGQFGVEGGHGLGATVPYGRGSVYNCDV